MRKIIYPEEYLAIIEMAAKRGLTKKSAKEQGIGGQMHHIIPKSVAPELTKEKSNIVFLTYEEHYNVHRILAEANPNDYIAIAWSCMATSKKTKRFFNSEDYAKAMELNAALNSKRMIGDNNPSKRKEVVEKQVAKRKGKPAHNKGVPMSEEQKIKVSIGRKGKCCGPDNPMYGKKGKEAPGYGKKKKPGTGRPFVKVYCIEHPELGIFECAKYAERKCRELGFASIYAQGILSCCKGKLNHSGLDLEGRPLHWIKV